MALSVASVLRPPRDKDESEHENVDFWSRFDVFWYCFTQRQYMVCCSDKILWRCYVFRSILVWFFFIVG